MARTRLASTIMAELSAVSYSRARSWACFPLVSSLASHSFYPILNYPRLYLRQGWAQIRYGMALFTYLFPSFKCLHFGSPQMSATGIVALFSLLSAASAGAHGSVGGLLSMLSAMR
jgi:hypothetical protein